MVPSAPALRRLRAGCLHGGDPLLHLTGQVRHLAEYALYQHELAAMVHLVLLGAEKHLEARLAGRHHPRRELDALRQERLGEAIQGSGELLAFRAQQFQNLGLRPRHPLLGHNLVQEGEEVEAHERVAVLDEVNLLLKARAHGDVNQRLGDAAAFRRGAEAVAFLRDLFGDLDGIAAHRAEARGHFFRSVISHRGSSEWYPSLYLLPEQRTMATDEHG